MQVDIGDYDKEIEEVLRLQILNPLLIFLKLLHII